METTASEPERVTLFDRIGLAAGGLGVALALVLALRVGPTFRKMFADFGGQLPRATELGLVPWLPPVVALVPPLLIVTCIGFDAPRKARAVLMAASIAMMLGLPAAFLAAMYQPIFALADAVSAPSGR
jgi:hypothetical protein